MWWRRNEILLQQFVLHQQQFWRYLQIRHLLTETFAPPCSDLSRCSWNILMNDKETSQELRTRLMQWVNRVCWSQGEIKGQNCWSCGTSVGTLLHMLWSSPVAQKFWSAVYENIKMILKLDVTFCPSLFVLGDTLPLKSLAASHSDWVQTSLMLGRKLIVTEWKAITLPAREWFSQLGIVVALEDLRLSNQMEQYYSKWVNYISFVKSPWCNYMTVGRDQKQS